MTRRAAVKDAAACRRAALDASRKFQDFSADVDDLRGWMADKLKTASDESYRDLTNLERKLQKHEAFERELHANEGQLRTVNKVSYLFLLERALHYCRVLVAYFLYCQLHVLFELFAWCVADWTGAAVRGQL